MAQWDSAPAACKRVPAMIPGALVEHWRRRADELAAYTPPAAAAYRRAADDLEAALQPLHDTSVSPPRAHLLQFTADAGQFPDPEALERCRAVQSDAPERMTSMAEEEARRRHRREAVAGWTEAIERVGRTLTAGIISLGLAGVGIVLLLDGGRDAPAFALIVCALAPIIKCVAHPKTKK